MKYSEDLNIGYIGYPYAYISTISSYTTWFPWVSTVTCVVLLLVVVLLPAFCVDCVLSEEETVSPCARVVTAVSPSEEARLFELSVRVTSTKQ